MPVFSAIGGKYFPFLRTIPGNSDNIIDGQIKRGAVPNRIPSVCPLFAYRLIVTILIVAFAVLVWRN
jgi:hypothetical protein